MKKFPIFLVAFISFTANIIAQTNTNPVNDILFVKTSSSGTGDGSSWDDAFDGKDLAWFLRNKAVIGTVIHLAESTYLPYNADYDLAGTNTYSFLMTKADLKIFGGYAPSLTALTHLFATEIVILPD